MLRGAVSRFPRPRSFFDSVRRMAAPAAPAFSAVINGVAVPVTARAGIDVARAIDCVPFRDWCSTMDPALRVLAVEVTDVDFFGPRVGFLKFRADVDFHGVRVPGIVFLRGGAVAILVVVQCEGEKFVVCCRQPRVPCGQSAFLEIPAGMLDGSGKFAGVAAKELEEETGISIKESELVDMTAAAFPAGTRGWYPSVGACDEFLRLLCYETAYSREELDALRGKATGVLDDGEVITLDIVPLADLWRLTPDGKTLAALYLYEKLVGTGQIKGAPAR